MTTTIGFVSPSVLQVPLPIAAQLPEHIRLVATGLNVLSHIPSEFERLSHELPRACQALAADGARSILVSAVPHALYLGANDERELYERAALESGVPVHSGAAAMLQAVKAGGSERVLVLAAYSASVNAGWCDYLQAHQLRLSNVVTLGATGPASSAKLGPQDYVNALAAASEMADAVVLGVRSGPIAVADAVTAASGLPVYTVVQSGLATVLADLGYERSQIERTAR